jgi:hypothetical protein
MRTFLKSIIQAFFLVAAFPFYLVYLINLLIGDKDRVFSSFSQLFSLVPGQFGTYLRVAFFRLSMQACNKETVISFGTLFSQQNTEIEEGNPIQGAALLPMLLTLGFKFGDQDIFHRHVNASGKGPVLFSLANMFKPGNFDIDNLENFTTLGISLFMILPIEGDPHQVFNMMHNAARKIADEFSAQVYDGRRTLLTKQSLQQYVEKIREFERKRMVNRQ